MAIEANTSIKPNIIGLLSAGNEKKVSHENSRFFSLLRLTAIKKIKNKKASSVWQQTRYWKCHCTKTFSGHHIWLLASFFHQGHLFDFPYKKQKPIIGSILSSDTCIVTLQWHWKKSFCFQRMVCQWDRLLFCPGTTQSLSLSKWKSKWKILFEKL